MVVTYRLLEKMDTPQPLRMCIYKGLASFYPTGRKRQKLFSSSLILV